MVTTFSGNIFSTVFDKIKNAKGFSFNTGKNTYSVNKEGIAVVSSVDPSIPASAAQPVTVVESTFDKYLKYGAVIVPVALFLLSRGKK